MSMQCCTHKNKYSINTILSTVNFCIFIIYCMKFKNMFLCYSWHRTDINLAHYTIPLWNHYVNCQTHSYTIVDSHFTVIFLFSQYSTNLAFCNAIPFTTPSTLLFHDHCATLLCVGQFFFIVLPWLSTGTDNFIHNWGGLWVHVVNADENIGSEGYSKLINNAIIR